jgi:hypothetical protein
LQCAVVLLYSVVNTGKVRNCLIQFLLTVVLEEHVFLVEYMFPEGNTYTDLVQEQFADKFPETSVPYRNAVRRLMEKFHETSSVLDAERSGRPSELNDKKLMDISDSLLQSASKSLRKSTIPGLQQCIERSEKN